MAAEPSVYSVVCHSSSALFTLLASSPVREDIIYRMTCAHKFLFHLYSRQSCKTVLGGKAKSIIDLRQRHNGYAVPPESKVDFISAPLP